MPIRHCIVHFIDKKPDGSPSVLHARESELPSSQALENMLADLNESYNAKAGKGWGLFRPESGAYPFCGWLKAFVDGKQDFAAFSREAVEHLQNLIDESNLATGGHVLFIHYQQGMTDYLLIGLIHHSEGVALTETLDVKETHYLDLGRLQLAARINLSEWQNNQHSKQYISYIKGRNGRRISDYFREFIGCQEGVDGPGETRTLLKAFSDYVESEDVPERQAKEMTDALVGYASSQSKLGQSITLEQLSGVIDEARPAAFYEHIRNKDYGLSPEIPADKRTLNAFRRFTGRAEGLSISFESHLLGSKVEFDQGRGTLTLRSLPLQLIEQLKKAAPDDTQCSPHAVSSAAMADCEDDPLYEEAVEYVRETRRASISALQRKFLIGYNRAARMVEGMENAGVVSAVNSSGARDVLLLA